MFRQRFRLSLFFSYISLIFTSSFNDKISNEEDDRILELLEDGTNKIELWINLGSRKNSNHKKKSITQRK